MFTRLSNRLIAPAICSAVLVAFSTPSLAVADDLSGAPGAPAALPKPGAKRDADLTGEDIYAKVLENTFNSFIQESSLHSGDRGGNEQFSRFKMWYKSEEQEGVAFQKGDIVSKSLVQYTEPFDIRHSGYLVLTKNEEMDDQFVYMPSQRRVKRVNLRGEAVFGTDFSFEDILPRELEDATYARKGDEETAGRSCFVVEAIPNEIASSEYSRMIVHIDKQWYVPLLTRYWDDRDVEIKELRAEPDSVVEMEGVWLAKRMTMRHLKLQTYTRYELAEIEPNKKLTSQMFELRRLESRGR